MKLGGDHPRYAWRHARRLGQAAVVAHVPQPSRIDYLGHVGRQHTLTNTHARRSELVHAPTLTAPPPAAPIAKGFKCPSEPLGNQVRPRPAPPVALMGLAAVAKRRHMLTAPPSADIDQPHDSPTERRGTGPNRSAHHRDRPARSSHAEPDGVPLDASACGPMVGGAAPASAHGSRRPGANRHVAVAGRRP